MNAQERALHAVENDIAAILVHIDKLEVDRDDLWERMHRQQAKVAARARREVAKEPEEGNTLTDADINRQIAEGTMT